MSINEPGSVETYTIDLFRTCVEILQECEDDTEIEYDDIRDLLHIQCGHLFNDHTFEAQLRTIFQVARDSIAPDPELDEYTDFEASTPRPTTPRPTTPRPTTPRPTTPRPTTPAATDYVSRMTAHLDALRAVWQPVQRTTEWYNARRTMITASNAYKAFGSQSLKNALIYEKCKPSPEEDGVVAKSGGGPPNTNSPMHWGVKYEPLSVMWYEYTRNTKIGEFGCIPHPKYPFIGASPDGVNIDPTSPLFGRMLEIKNVVSRVITGVPKHEYMVQMQLQMEVCDLDECDFLETKFVEFEDSAAFYAHIQQPVEAASCGCVMQFYDATIENYKYEFMPLDTPLDRDAIRTWQANTMDALTSREDNPLHWFDTRYWRLDTVSCVLIQRDRKWFQERVHELKDIWDTILAERESGFTHRAPKSRPKKEPPATQAGQYECSITKWAKSAMMQQPATEPMGPLEGCD